jgi:hypothetical protein
MADFYVLSSKKLHRHPTYASAALERERLKAKNADGQEIFIYRCKTTIRSNGNYTDMETYVRQQAEAGDAEAAALIARIDAQNAEHPCPQGDPSVQAPEVAA